MPVGLKGKDLLAKETTGGWSTARSPARETSVFGESAFSRTQDVDPHGGRVAPWKRTVGSR